MKREFVEQIMKESSVDANVEDVKQIVGDVQKQKLSKSKAMLQLYHLGFFVGDIAKLLNVRYNFVYNVVSDKVGTIRKKQNKVEQSKSQRIRQLYRDGYGVSDICRQLAEEGTYVNYNHAYSVVRKEKQKIAQEEKAKENNRG